MTGLYPPTTPSRLDETKVILFNGAKLCGKDTALEYLWEKGIPMVRRECKDHLHKLTMAFFNVKEERYWQIYNDRGLKEKPLIDFRLNLYEEEINTCINLGMFVSMFDRDMIIFDELSDTSPTETIINLSIREAMIYVSEIICKPRFGQEYFGRVRAQNLERGMINVDGSCGFVEELNPLIDAVGQENILLIRIHRDGYTFEGDSRGLIPDGVLDNTIDIYNNGTLQEFLDNVYEEVNTWLQSL